MNNISLIGFMGSGKTTLGKTLAKKINHIFIDLDKIIELSENKAIDEIFKIGGEEYFRDIESKIIKNVYLNEDCVFACGGGVILRPENMKIIKENSKVVYLEISEHEAIKRLNDSSKRPLLQYSDRAKTIKDLLNKRRKLYTKYADITLDTGDISVDQSIDNILGKIRVNFN